MEWYWWLLLAFVGLGLIVRFSRWRRVYRPIRSLERQASSMDWETLGVVTDRVGYKTLYVSKGDMQACISFDSRRIILIEPAVERTFKDFVELEQWLQMARIEGSPIH